MEEIEFLPGSKVLLQDKFTKKWSKGIIVEKTKFPRSYIVKDDKGKLIRRNTHFIKRLKEYYDFDRFDEENDKTIIENKESIKIEDNKEEEEKMMCKEKNDEKVEMNCENLNKTRYGRIVKKTENMVIK